MTAAAATTEPTWTRPSRGRDVALVWNQVRYEEKSFWRNPQSAFFTFAFPVMIFVIFGAVFNSTKKDMAFGARVTPLQYYVPAITALSVVGACYRNLAIRLSMRRQFGVLKRVRGTPLPAWGYFAGLLVHCIVISVIDVGLLVGIGAAYGVVLRTAWGAILVTLVIGALAFCALGVAVSALISNAEAAPAAVAVILFPLLFISGTYFPIASSFLNTLANIFPVRPFTKAIFTPFAAHGGLDLAALRTVLIWGLVAAVVAVHRFRWDARAE